MFTYNGIDFGGLVHVQDVVRPILAPQKLTTVSIEGRAGSIFVQKVSDSYAVEIEFSMVADSPSGLRDAVRDLADKLDADEPKPLIILDEPDKYINAVLSDDSTLETSFNLAQGKIKFYAPDPFWYAVVDNVFTYTDTNLHNFTRDGNANSYPIIEIKGVSGSGDSFTLTTGNTTMKYTGALTSSQSLLLDSESLTAYIKNSDGTQTSVLNKLDNLDFPVLTKGANSVQVTTGGGATLTNYKVTCNSRWK
jgi:predicted phage tail component-like protein